MIRPILLVLTILSLAACNNSKSEKSQITFDDRITVSSQPNVIIILIDDAGYVDFGFMGSEDLQTPHIDHLAANGVIFRDAHVSATVCAPSRAGLITGKYQQRFGFEANSTGGIGLSDEVVTMADIFKKNGYNTYALGKWHLGEEKSDHPNSRGFDQFYGFISGSRSYFPIDNPSVSNMLQHNGERVIFDGYMTDVLGNQSIKYIEESGNNPFFMYLAYNAVHTPMEAKEEDLAKFKNHPRQKLAAMTWSLDENVGKLLDKLDRMGVRENTLIYFLSDNGGAHNNESSTGALKGWKGNQFEGGHRVPFVISWPKGIEKRKTFDGLTSALDIFPTSLAAANIEKPEDLILDGKNLLPYLSGQKVGDPHEQLFWRKLEASGARMGNYKSITLEGYGSVLYNLKNDLGESKDLSKSYPEEFELLKGAFEEWEKELQSPLWDEGTEWKIIQDHIHKRLMQNKPVLYKDIWNPAYKNRKTDD